MPSNQPFIDPQTARIAYEESYRWLRIYDDPIDEFERLARNRPSLSIDPSLPKVTDGTLAAIIQEQPKRIVQQAPTGQIVSDEHPEFGEVADVVLTDKLMPIYNRNGNLLQKSWNMIGKAMTQGKQASYTFFTATNGILHTDFVLPYIKDDITEKGKTFAADSNYRFLRSWYQKTDLKAILNRELSLQKTKKGYTSEWDLKLLAQFIEDGDAAIPANLQTPAQKEKGGNNGGYEVIHAFQVGKDAEFYSFAPRFQDGKNLRVKTNNDPRGRMPMDDLYCNIDLSNPRGRGQVELSGGVQNLIDQQMQMFQFMTTYQQAPALQVWGNVNKATLKIRPGAIWDMGSSPNNKVERDIVSDAAMTNFANNYGLLKSQILNLNSSQDHSISASQAPSSQSKTSQGVQAAEQKLGVSDNYLRKQFETWFGNQSSTSVNIHFAEMKGSEKIQLNQMQIDDLQSGPAAKFIKKDSKTGKEYLDVTYDAINKVTFDMQVDAGTSEEVDDQDQLVKMKEIMDEVGANPLVINWFLGQSGKKIQMGELYTQRFKSMRLKNLDSILVDMEPKEAEAAKTAEFPIVDKPQVRMMLDQMPPAAVVGALRQAGITISPEDAMVAPAGVQHKAQTDMQMKQQELQMINHPKTLQEQIDVGDIYKDPRTSASILAQIQELAGLQPDEQETQNQIDTADTQHAADQATHHQTTVDAVRAITSPPATPIDPNSPEAQNAKADAAVKINAAKPVPGQISQSAKKSKTTKTTKPSQPVAQPMQPAPEATETPAQEIQETPQQEQQEIEQNFAADPLTPQEEQQVVQLIQQGVPEDQIEQMIMESRKQMQGQQQPQGVA